MARFYIGVGEVTAMNEKLSSFAKRILYLEDVLKRVKMLRDVAEIRGDILLVKTIDEEVLGRGGDDHE